MAVKKTGWESDKFWLTLYLTGGTGAKGSVSEPTLPGQVTGSCRNGSSSRLPNPKVLTLHTSCSSKHLRGIISGNLCTHPQREVAFSVPNEKTPSRKLTTGLGFTCICQPVQAALPL